MANNNEEVKTTKKSGRKTTIQIIPTEPAPQKNYRTNIEKVTVKTAETSAKIEKKKARIAPPVKKEPPKKYHITQRASDNMWQVKAEGAEKALKLFKTQKEAIDYATKVADNQDGNILIHKKDGSFRKLTY